jgi:hypothetical protein
MVLAQHFSPVYLILGKGTAIKGTAKSIAGFITSPLFEAFLVFFQEKRFE